MSGLAHYLESEGVPTVLIALIRLHAEKMRPPRALAVPFELGRPFGAPNEPEFQTRVLRAALGLLERRDGPVILDDFPDSPPSGPEDMEGWACPINLPPLPSDTPVDKVKEAVLNELALLKPWHDRARGSRGKSVFGISALTPDAAAAFVCDFIRDQTTANPRPELTLGRMLKLATDDLRTFYFEAATAKPGRVTDVDVGNWFWGETALGKAFLKLRDIGQTSEDPEIQRLGTISLVPAYQAHRKA